MKESQSKVLAKLCIYGILSTMESTETNRKRPREDDEDLSPMAKMRKTGIDQQSVGSGVETATGEKDQSTHLKESLRSCLQELFKIFHQQMSIDEMSPKVNFIYQFFALFVQLEKSPKLRAVLKLIPSGMITNLLKIVPEEDMSYGLILR
jgi:mediator of RNA polymerase II transcription subunit 24